MSLKAYEDACTRAELFGQPLPDREDFLSKHKHLDVVEFEEVEIRTAENTAMLDDQIKEGTGGLTELNTILDSTQTKINKLKGVCGTITNFFRVKMSAKDNLSYSSEPSYVGQTNYDKDYIPPSSDIGSINQGLGPGDNEMTPRAGKSKQNGGDINTALDDLKKMEDQENSALLAQTVEMLQAFIICQLLALVVGNPFHKYPSVFLLDVGNEELEKTNTEQIRLSIPGGSLAIRYPAIGNGNTIGHIRVSSIDFGTALKANIVDGGPGYKYVVIVLMGNQGVPYDAVVTVQTVDDESFNIPNIGYVPSGGGDVQVEEDANNSAEDMSDSSQENISVSDVQNTNAEVMQSSHNVYNYVESDVTNKGSEIDDDANSDDDNDGPSDELDAGDDDETESDQQEAHNEYAADIDQVDDPNVEVKGIDTEDEDDDEEISPELAQSIPNDFAEDNNPARDGDSRIISNNDESRPYLSGGQLYEETEQNDDRSGYQQLPLDYEGPDEINQIFNDGEIHHKYKDSNNNIDSDDTYAVAY
uniref:Uncharacterized protein n=1 Tax=Heliothis virescens TaxID=7102 RepID=A0A2A4K4X6_HELVI